MTVSNCTFIRLLGEEDKGAALSYSLNTLQKGEASTALFSTDPSKFSMVPGSPFAYWVSDHIRQLFVNLPPFESEGRGVKAGLCTGDDFQFIRLWWEINPSKITTGSEETKSDEVLSHIILSEKWVPFAKGGEYSPFYADVHLVVNWKSDGKEIKEGARNGTLPGARPQNTDYYFRPGLTWPLRTNGLSFRILPRGCIFGHKGPAVFECKNSHSELLVLNAMTQSAICNYLVSVLVARVSLAQSYEVGLIQSIPMPKISNQNRNKLENYVRLGISLKEKIHIRNEMGHLFCSPLPPPQINENIANEVYLLNKEASLSIEHEKNILEKIDSICFELYEIADYEREIIHKTTSERPTSVNSPSKVNFIIVADFLSYAFGCIFGRWDIHYATGEKEPPELPDPFAPLPPCSPGMLQGDDGLPLEPHEIPADYPLAVDADGILVDDEGHSDDIIARIRDVLLLIWGDRADAIEKEACEILGVKSLRDYFRKPGTGGFWDGHVKRYSKSRRKAPIYWLFQSAKKNYSIWIYYPRMDGDTLYKALRYAKDKLAMEVRRLEDMTGRREEFGTGGPAVKKLEKEIDSQGSFVSELHEFVEKLEQAANLNLIPEHDDGVVLTIAPLWEIVPWKEPKKYWDELIDGKYEWSSIGKQLAENGLIKRS